MKVIVMFDLPTGTDSERRTYARFRKGLIGEGFAMLQFSVYAKTCLGVRECETAIARIKGFLPDAGSVTAFVMTEKQYAAREIMVKPLDHSEPFDPGEQLTLSF